MQKSTEAQNNISISAQPIMKQNSSKWRKKSKIKSVVKGFIAQEHEN
jgi:hypothetical protein